LTEAVNWPFVYSSQTFVINDPIKASKYEENQCLLKYNVKVF